MRTCYNCDAILSNKTRTAEHVFPNAIGGRLISYKLLCRKCNIVFGETIDAELAIQYDNLVTSLSVERHRLKRYSNQGEEEPVKSYQPQNYFLDDAFQIDIEAAGDQFFKAIAKIAVGVYLHQGGDRRYIRKIVDILNDRLANDRDISYNPAPDLSTWRESEVSHCVQIKGNTQKKSLHARVILFSSFSFLVSINDSYDGADLEYTYCYDIVGQQVIEKTLNMDYSYREKYPDQLKSNSNEANATIINSFKQSLARVLLIAESRQDRKCEA